MGKGSILESAAFKGNVKTETSAKDKSDAACSKSQTGCQGFDVSGRPREMDQTAVWEIAPEGGRRQWDQIKKSVKRSKSGRKWWYPVT